MVLQANQLEAPAPGIRGVVLSKKPAAELAHSKQKLVQGMVEFSLETPRTSAAIEAAARQAMSDAAGVPSDAMNKERSELSALNKDRARIGASPHVGDIRSTARNTEDQPTYGKKTTVGLAAARKKWGRNNDEEVKTIQTKPTEGQKRKQIATGQPEEKQYDESAARSAAENGDEWEGVTWDELDVDGAESLGTVSARLTCADSASLNSAGSITLGTVELASETGGSHPQDVLICLQGIAGMRQVTQDSNSRTHVVAITEWLLEKACVHRKWRLSRLLACACSILRLVEDRQSTPVMPSQ